MELSFPLVLLTLAAGILLIAIEVFVTPGVGVKGLLGVLLVIGAVVIAFAQHGVARGGLVLGVAMLAIVAGGWVAKVTIGRRLVLRDQVASDVALEPTIGRSVGERGVALSALRPSGIARFGDLRLDVTCEGEFVEPGTSVVIEAVRGNKVIVKRE